MAKLYCNLGAILKVKGMPQSQLYTNIRARPSTISDLVNNKAKYIDVQLIADICDYLNITVNDLFSVEK